MQGIKPCQEDPCCFKSSEPQNAPRAEPSGARAGEAPGFSGPGRRIAAVFPIGEHEPNGKMEREAVPIRDHLPSATRDSQHCRNLPVETFPSGSATPSLPRVFPPDRAQPLTSSLRETFYNGKKIKNTTATGRVVLWDSVPGG